MKTLWICRLLLLSSLIALSWLPGAQSTATRPASELAEYVYLHVTRGEAAPAAGASALSCRGNATTPVRI